RWRSLPAPPSRGIARWDRCWWGTAWPTSKSGRLSCSSSRRCLSPRSSRRWRFARRRPCRSAFWRCGSDGSTSKRWARPSGGRPTSASATPRRPPAASASRSKSASR
ncbi:unnamed protein product, partial [Phaeothamnion confervicola]